MAMTNNTLGVLDAITAMQQNAQSALPVIPNNGNPQGANNMPATIQQPQQTTTVRDAFASKITPTEHYYPWMAPSPAVSQIHNRLQGMQKPLQIAQPGIQQSAIQQALVQQPTQRTAPVLPMDAGPRRTRFGTWEQMR